VYPSGGATYSLEVYLAVSDEAVDGVGAGVYHYCPSRHLLEILTDDAARAAPFLRAAAVAAQQHSAAAIALLITSRIARVSAKYERIPLSLVFQEAGCLFQTLYLTATALGLAPCAIGAAHGGEELARLAGFDPLEEPVVGRFILGGRH
jgi:SagB-type dehydrogenase family enzyme